MLNENDLKQNEIFRLLDSLNLSSNEYLIMGSGIMFVLGIRPFEELDDLDLFVTNSAFEKVKNLGEVQYDEEWDCKYVFLFDKKIEIWNGWGPGVYSKTKQKIAYSFSDLHSRTIYIGKYPFEDILDVLEWKIARGKQKDIKHIEMINKYLRKN